MIARLLLRLQRRASQQPLRIPNCHAKPQETSPSSRDEIMQVLWSRAAQARSCRCASCLNAATTAITRRTTTAAGKRRFKAGDALTALSSAMFATAALADAKVKEDRQRQWDKAIADVKAGRSPTTPDGASTFAPSDSPLTEEELPYLVDSLSKAIPGLFDSPAAPRTLNELSFSNRDYNSVSNTEHTPISLQLKILDAHLKELMTGDLIRPRQPRTTEHLDSMQRMVARLVGRLLLEIKRSHVRANPDCKKTTSLMRSLQIPSVKHISTSLPGCSSRSAVDTNLKINQAIATIFNTDSADSNTIHSTVLKICYLLLISNSQPNVSTYHAMIDAFHKKKQWLLAKVVINSLLFESMFGPDQRTIALALTNYTAIGDSHSFKRLVRQMRGDLSGLGRHRHLTEILKPDVQHWASTYKIMHRNSYLIEKIPRNSEIFDKLIRGALRLDTPQRALMYFRAALREGATVSANLFATISSRVVASEDRDLCYKLIKALLLQWRSGLNKFSGLDYSAKVRSHVYQLFQACALPVDFLQNNSSVPQIPNSDLESFNCLIRHLYFQKSRQAVLTYAGQVELLRAKISSHPNKTTESKSQRLQSLMSTLDALENELISWFYGNLSTENRQRYDQFVKQSQGAQASTRLTEAFALLQNTLSGITDFESKDISEWEPSRLIEDLDVRELSNKGAMEATVATENISDIPNLLMPAPVVFPERLDKSHVGQKLSLKQKLGSQRPAVIMQQRVPRASYGFPVLTISRHSQMCDFDLQHMGA